MAKRIQLHRLLGMAVLLVLAFVGLGARLVDLQVVRHDELSAKALRNTMHEFVLEPRRGDILDAKGNILVTSEQVKTVCANPSLLGNLQAEVARALAPLLQESEASLCERLMPRTHRSAKGQMVTNQCVELKHKVKLETWERIQQTMTNLTFGASRTNLTAAQRTFYHDLRAQAIFARNDQVRFYPNQSLAAHVLGYASSEPRELDGISINEIAGQDGVEQAFDVQLAGVQGRRLTETDLRRRELVKWREQDIEPRDGLNVVLTIDSVIQRLLETALAEGMEKHAPISISGIVVRPRTGEILAMATLPTYDPNNPGAVPPDARRNRVVADIAEPGSTFKVVVVSGALNEGLLDLTNSFDCRHGLFHYAGRTLHDHNSYDVLTVEQIITKSSNIGAALIGIQLGPERLYDYIQRFGFGVATGVPLPGEVSGRRFVRPPKHWSKVSVAQIPMGQGISVTRLQMTMALCAIANNGVLMRPMLVDRLEERNHSVVAKYFPQRVRQVISPATAKMMVAALKTVVSAEGTAPKAALEHYTVAGKTGTAQKVIDGAYSKDRFFSSFQGFFPADNPELCISISMDEPKHGYFGGQAAAPIFKQVAERAASYLGIPPDRLEEPALPEGQELKTVDVVGHNPLSR
ncbi:MAG TPA: penicillin-binding protein 2 [Dongiaceae bacterium]|nr:penicillin-binding protein 2 [Dongiaceae bacterium]